MVKKKKYTSNVLSINYMYHFLFILTLFKKKNFTSLRKRQNSSSSLAKDRLKFAGNVHELCAEKPITVSCTKLLMAKVSNKQLGNLSILNFASSTYQLPGNFTTEKIPLEVPEEIHASLFFLMPPGLINMQILFQ